MITAVTHLTDILGDLDTAHSRIVVMTTACVIRRFGGMLFTMIITATTVTTIVGMTTNHRLRKNRAQVPAPTKAAPAQIVVAEVRVRRKNLHHRAVEVAKSRQEAVVV